MVKINELVRSVPSSEDIDKLERRLSSMKKIREEAKQAVVSNISELVDQELLPYQDLLKLQKIVAARLASGHIKRRGHRVPPKLKENLDAALQLHEYSLSQLSKMFNLSISYIARRKKELGLTSKITKMQPELQPA